MKEWAVKDQIREADEASFFKDPSAERQAKENHLKALSELPEQYLQYKRDHPSDLVTPEVIEEALKKRKENRANLPKPPEDNGS